MTTYEMPEVGVPEWFNGEREAVVVDGYKYATYGLEDAVRCQSRGLARLVKAQEFVADEAEKSRLDCAGENAFIADRAFHENTPIDYRSWDELRKSECAYWVAVAKAVLDGEH